MRWGVSADRSRKVLVPTIERTARGSVPVLSQTRSCVVCESINVAPLALVAIFTCTLALIKFFFRSTKAVEV